MKNTINTINTVATTNVEPAVHYGILDVDQSYHNLRVGFTSTNAVELAISVANEVVEKSLLAGEDYYTEYEGKSLSLLDALDVLSWHGFQVAIIPGYVAELIKDEASAVVSTEPQYFFDGSYLGIYRTAFDARGGVIKGREVA